MKNTAFLPLLLLLSACATAPKTPTPTPSPSPTPAASPKPAERAATRKYPDQAEFTVNCRFQDQSFSLRFQSKSGKLENHDQSITLVMDDREIPLKLAPGLYHAVDSASALTNHCEGVPAYQFDQLPQLLLFFNLDVTGDAKTPQSETSVALIDLKSKRVVNKLERIGHLKPAEVPGYHVIPAENGFQVRLIRDPATGAEDWKRIILRKGSVTAKWMHAKNAKPKEY